MSDEDKADKQPPPSLLHALNTQLDSRGGAGRTTIPEGSRALEEQDVIGGYPVSGALGAGGMGEVWEVEDTRVGRRIALKRMRVEGADARAKFLREAQLTGRLEHPGIVPLYELGRTADGAPYFTMKRVHGRTLGQLLDAGAPRRELLGILQRVCEAISFAHSRNVIHRDLKPENIMVGDFGEVLVMDWGLAKAIGDQEILGGSSLNLEDRSTLDGTIMGTAAYMPPEQARGDIGALGPAADTYALGAILYEMLAGSTPYGPGSSREVLERILAGPPPPPSSRAEVPRELEAVVLHAMAPDPAQRYADVGAMRADIEAYLAGHTLHAAYYTAGQRLAKWAGRNRKALAAATLALALAGAGGGWLYHRAGVERRNAITRMQARVAQLPIDDPDSLLAALRTQQRRDPDEQGWATESAHWRKRLPRYLNRITALDRLERLGPAKQQQIVAQRHQACLGLVRLAMLAGDFGVADWALRQLPPRQAKELRAAVQARKVWRRNARTRVTAARLTRHEKRLKTMLEQLGGDLASPHRRESWTLDDYVLEAAGYVDLQTVRMLGGTLRKYAEKAASAPQRSWSDSERTIAGFCCRVLSRLAREPELTEPAIEVLAVWARAPVPRQLQHQAGLALCRSGTTAAFDAVFAMRRRLGADSRAWLRLQRYIKTLPLREVRTQDATAFHQRGLVLMARQQYRRALADLERALKLRPDDPRILADRASAQIELKNATAAINGIARGLARKDLTKAQRALLLAVRALAQQHFPGGSARAKQDLDAAVALDDRPYLRLRRGAFFLHSSKLALAELDFSAVLDHWPNHTYALYSRGIVRLNLSQHRLARADFDRALKIEPTSARIIVARAQLFIVIQERSRARTEIARALKLQPGFADAYLARAQMYEAEGDVVRARADLDRAIQNEPEKPEPYLARANLRAKTGDPTGAIADARRYQDRGGSAGAAATVRARVWLLQGDIKRALKEVDDAIAYEPEMPQMIQLRALLRQRMGDIKGAREDLAHVTRLRPDNLDAWIQLADACLATGDRSEARKAIDRARTLAPKSARVWLLSALLRLQGSDAADRAKALPELDKAIALDPTYGRPHLLRAQIYLERNDLARAMDAVQESLRLSPREAKGYLVRGTIKLRKGDKAGAQADFVRARELDPSLGRRRTPK